MGKEFQNMNDCEISCQNASTHEKVLLYLKSYSLRLDSIGETWAGLLHYLTTSVPQMDLRENPPLSFPHWSYFPMSLSLCDWSPILSEKKD